VWISCDFENGWLGNHGYPWGSLGNLFRKQDAHKWRDRTAYLACSLGVVLKIKDLEVAPQTEHSYVKKSENFGGRRTLRGVNRREDFGSASENRASPDPSTSLDQSQRMSVGWPRRVSVGGQRDAQYHRVRAKPEAPVGFVAVPDALEFERSVFVDPLFNT